MQAGNCGYAHVRDLVCAMVTGGPSSQYEELYCVFFFFLLLCERSARRDMGHILYYLTIELDHAKHDSRLAAYGGVLLQRLEGLKL